MREWTVECDVTPWVPVPGEHVLRGIAYAPDVLDPTTPPVVVWCLAGGRCTISYFDLHVDGLDGYSMVRDLTERGVLVVSLDHLGLGASSALDDICVVTPRIAAATHDHAVRTLTDRLRRGTLCDDLAPIEPAKVIGLGHSMGGMVVVVEQARHDTFDAIAVLGHSADGTWEALTDEERHLMDMAETDREHAIADLARVRARGLPPDTARRAPAGSFFNADVPRSVKQAFGSQRTELLYSCALSTMVPGHTDVEKASVTVPVLLAFGDHDLTDDYEGNAARYRSSNDVTLFVLADSAHCHNQAATRAALWTRMAEWISSRSA